MQHAVSQSILEEAHKQGMSSSDYDADNEINKQEIINRAFASLVNKVRRENELKKSARPAQEEEEEEDEDQTTFSHHHMMHSQHNLTDEDEDKRSSDDDQGSENLSEFSDIGGALKLSDDDEEEEEVKYLSGHHHTHRKDFSSSTSYFHHNIPSSSSSSSQQQQQQQTTSTSSHHLNQILSANTDRRKKNLRVYPEERKQRGYHKWAGKSVALLSTGQTGVIVKKPGGRIKVRLDYFNKEVSSSEEKLHLMQYDISDPQEALDEIYDAAHLVPQFKDLKIGQRVAMIRLDNATGKIVKLPDEKRASVGLGHVSVELDDGGDIKKSVIESLRLLDDNHPSISAPQEAEKIVGRPTKANVSRKPTIVPINPIVPHSKRGEEWKNSLKPPKEPIVQASPPSSPISNFHHSHIPGSSDDSRRFQKKVKMMGGDLPSSPSKPLLNRGQKVCKSCQAIIGTASRVCSHCGATCPKRLTSSSLRKI